MNANPPSTPASRQSGFTLVELVIVMAISSLLAVIAFMGQSALRARADFDNAVDKTIQNINYARNFATSNVNQQGDGTDVGTLLIGVGLEFDQNHLTNSPPYPLTEMEPLYAPPAADGYPDLTRVENWPPGGGSSCVAAQHPIDGSECWEEFFNLPTDITISTPGDTIAEIYYINTAHGLEVCQDVGGSYSPSIYDACQTNGGANIMLDLADTSGNTAQIQVNGKSGFAKRLH